ncbi:ankyrin repeat domain-containing protein [Jannaschia donghaensis]|uniref:ankyrin repeat domain-containing protein n=1 Tax=Jannaschia donghaensis TaxID=420998 RepID=UPI0011876A93|nr:ankyrin repeat domain-containing protein [Jannaschia donghaensis]
MKLNDATLEISAIPLVKFIRLINCGKEAFCSGINYMGSFIISEQPRNFLWLGFSKYGLALSAILLSAPAHTQALDPFLSIVAEGSPRQVAEALLDEDLERLRSLRYGRGSHLAHASIYNKDNPIIIILLADFGISLNVQDHHGRTPLHYAIDNDLPVAGAVLIAKGARVDIPTTGGVTALGYCDNPRALQQNRLCKIIVELSKK